MPERDRHSPSSAIPWLWLIVGLSVIARGGAALYLGNVVTPQPGTADQVSYHTLALRVLDGHGFSFGTGWWPATAANEPTAHWSYPYVLFVAAVYGVFGPNPLAARIIQAVAVGVLQPALSYLVARRLFGPRVGIVTAALVAGYAYFIYYAGALMTESFFIVALLWSIDSAMRISEGRHTDSEPRGLWRWLGLGIALASAVLLRQAFLLVVPVILAWTVWRVTRRGNGREPAPRISVTAVAGRLALTMLVIGACLLPWTIRNYRAFHEFVLLNTNAGFAFYWGNHPVHGSRFIPILPGDGSLYGALIPSEFRTLNEAQMDRALLARGLDFVRADPGRYARLSVSRVVEYVKFWPSPESGRLSNVARVLSFGLCLPLMLGGLLIALREIASGSRREKVVRHADTYLVLSVACVYSLVHVLTWTLVRYRLPVDALLLSFAALAAVESSATLMSRGRWRRPDRVNT